MAQESSKIITPGQAKKNLLTYLDQVNDPSVVRLDTGISYVDEVLMGLSNTDMMIALARPSNMKTSWMIHYAIRGSAQALASQKTQMKYAPPIFITAETSTEELSIKVLSNFSNIDSRLIRSGQVDDWEQLVNDVDDMTKAHPIIFAGHSAVNPRRGLITINFIEDAVYEVTDRFGAPPRVIIVDYLQRIATPGLSDRRTGLGEVVERLKDLHMSVGCPLIMGSQAKREVDEKPIPIPESSDGKETGSIEETADVLISMMRPIKYWDLGSEIPKTNPPQIVTNDLFFMKILKQRNGDSNEGFWISADPKITMFTELETERL